MPERRVARAVTAAALVLLALVSLPRLRLDYARDVAFPELTVRLDLPPAAGLDAEETTRRWVVPIETALRSVGDLAGTRGNVDAGSATIAARFRRGTDSELKAARLASELAQLRARLPEGASLSIWPAEGGGGPGAVFAVTGAAASDRASRIADELRSTPGVRDIRVFGDTTDKVDVRLMTDAVTPESVADAIVHLTAPRRLGELRAGSRRVPVIAAPAAAWIRDVPVTTPALVRLGAISEIREHRAAPTTVARLDGRPAAALLVFRDDDVPLFAFDRAVSQVLGSRASRIWSDAAELRKILWRLAIAVVVASLVLAIGGGPRLGLYFPIAVAIVINVWRVTSMRVDAQTLLMTAIAIAAIAPFAAARLVSPLAALFVLLLPVAATFGSGALAPLLATPARDFAIASGCALVAAWLVASSALLRTGSGRLRGLLRNAASVVLACLTAGVFLLSWFGERLDPRRTEGNADRSRVYIRIALPSGTTPAQTITAAARVEEAIRDVDGVKRFWTWASGGNATIVIDADPSVQDPQRMELFRIRLRARIPPALGTVTIDDRFDRAASASLSETIEEQPFADESGGAYRFLLKGTDADAVRAAAGMMTTRIARLGVSRKDIEREWPEPSPQIELVPRMEGMDGAAEALAGRTTPPLERRLADGRFLGVAAPDEPLSIDDVPQRADVFARPLRVGDRLVAIQSAFTVRDVTTSGGTMRELGRFVLPMNVRVHAPDRDQALAKRADVDRTIATAPMPAGVVADRPSLAQWTFSAAKLRLVALAALLPLLLFTAAVIALSSVTRALLALAPAAVAVAFVAPILLIARARLDEITLLATGGAVCGVVALAVAALTRFAGRGVPGAYRVLRRHGGGVIAGSIAALALLGIAASARPAIGDAWRAPLLAAAATTGAGIPCALFLPASMDVLFLALRRRRSTIQSPAIWSDERTLPALAVRNLTKVYASGFRALRRVTFDLTPGVIGLLGPNGAGKTTLLRILTGLLEPARGTVFYENLAVGRENIAAFRRVIGFLPQEFNAYAGLTAAQFLDYWALERGMSNAAERRAQIEELLVVVGLDEHANRRVRDFSGGMRQRIGIARALLGNPPLLVVDEPTTGLDIDARRRFRDLLMALARRRIVILSTHIASDVEATASRLLLLSRGELRWDGTIEGLLARARGRVFESVVSDSDVREMTHRYRLTTRVRLAGGVRVRGVVAEGEPLPGPAAEPTLEEAYLSEISAGEAIRKGSFAFVFERGSR